MRETKQENISKRKIITFSTLRRQMSWMQCNWLDKGCILSTEKSRIRKLPLLALSSIEKLLHTCIVEEIPWGWLGALEDIKVNTSKTQVKHSQLIK